MTQTLIRMKDLYTRLTAIGLPKVFVREKLLPDWWDEEYEQTPGATLQAASYIARRLSLDLDSLLEEDNQTALNLPSQAKFKTQQGQDIRQVSLACCLAARIAQLVTYASKPAYQPLDISVAEIRQEILNTHSFVSLAGLLDFCWSRGIPVIHFSEFPKVAKMRKFDGMVSFLHDRPVIVISYKHSSPAWLLFIAAHEMGHIYKEHLANGAIVDEKIELISEDSEEAEANEVASELLLGNPNIVYSARRSFVKGEELAASALAISARDAIDPGVIALNFAWSKANQAKTQKEKNIAWATGTKALKLIEGETDAPAQINSYLSHNLDWNKLSDDNQEYLKTMLKI
jgi:Zn-dependent peptidase ImmA (M78 family)